MKLQAFSVLPLMLTLGGICANPAGAQKPVPRKAAHAAAALPFEESAFLWTQATDKDLGGDGDWGMYKKWLNLPVLGAETDPGDWSSWYYTTEGNYNCHWGDHQTRYGTKVLPDILLGIGSMPYDTNQSDSWGQKMAWEGKTWQQEADGDPAVMGHFVTLGENIARWNYKSVIIRMDYEFDGDWDPYGRLNIMPNMPGNFIKAWQNVVTTVKKTVHDKNPNVSVKFLWNPTDANVKIKSADYYPGDAYVDYIGFDSYDADYTGVYQSGVQPDEATRQKVWTTRILPRLQWFADFASAANPGQRNGYVAGRSVPLIAGEWGLWQVSAGGPGAGGDNPGYIQHMYDWMRDPKNNVYMECYFETPSNGRSTLWPGSYPVGTAGNPSWGTSGSPYPKSAAVYRTLFGRPIKPFVPPAPAALAAASGFRSAALSWKPSPSEPAATYSVYRGTRPGGESKIPIAFGLPATCSLSSGLQNGLTYYYTVKAVNSAGASAPSAEVSVKPAIPENFFLDGGFETETLSPWQVRPGGSAGASYTESSDKAHTGSRQYAHWSSDPYEVAVFQQVLLPNGSHTVSAWVKSSGGQSACQMEVTANGVKTVVPVPAVRTWTQISTPVTVTTGSLEVGFHSKASATQWLNVDDVVVK